MLAVVVLSIGYGCGMIALPLVSAAISELCPPQQTAGTMGVFMALAAVGGLIAPYATGVIVDNAATAGDGYALTFQGIGILGALAAIWCWCSRIPSGTASSSAPRHSLCTTTRRYSRYPAGGSHM